MRAEEHQRMRDFEDHYWWFVGRRDILRSLLDRHLAPPPPGRPRRILDVGCGSGALLSLLARYGRPVGLDPYRSALRLSRARGARRLVQSDATRLPFAAASAELVTAFDVLEHIADDRAALAEIGRVLAPGGQLCLTVPAYQFLWSEHDEVLEHQRRYTAAQVRERVEAAGLEVERLTYCITLLLPAALLLRVTQRLLGRLGHQPAHPPRCGLIELPGPLNRLCLATLRVEAAVLPRLDLPAGVSVLCLARRVG